MRCCMLSSLYVSTLGRRRMTLPRFSSATPTVSLRNATRGSSVSSTLSSKTAGALNTTCVRCIQEVIRELTGALGMFSLFINK